MSWWTRAYVGQKVVCIRDFGEPIAGPTFATPEMTKGDVVTISIIGETPFWDCGIFLEFSGLCHRYQPTYFAPIQKKSTEHQVKELIRKSLEKASPIKEDA